MQVSESKEDVSERFMALISGQPTPLQPAFGSFPSPTLSFQDGGSQPVGAESGEEAAALESSMAPWLCGSSSLHPRTGNRNPKPETRSGPN